jgi:glucosamine--fructose-6-phosphate aminotransferase (isomerizing)
LRGPAGRPGRPSLYTRYHAEVDWHGYLMIALSQSGATPEIISTCRAVRDAGATVIGITNEPGSPLAAAVDLVLATEAGPELAVPATKTVTAQLAALVTVAAALGPGPAMADTLAGLPGRGRRHPRDPGPPGSWPGAGAIDRLVVAGRGLGYAAALETALKVAETTGILAEGMSAADLYHGPIAAVYAGAPVLLVNAGGPADADVAGLRLLLDGRQAETARPAGPGRRCRAGAGDHRGRARPAAGLRAGAGAGHRPRCPRTPDQGDRDDLSGRTGGRRPGRDHGPDGRRLSRSTPTPTPGTGAGPSSR